jgi:PKD repeat protein
MAPRELKEWGAEMRTTRRAAAWCFAVLAGFAALTGLQTRAQTTWSKTYGGPLGDRFYRVVPLPDGSYVLSGSVMNASGDWDGRPVRVAPTGDVIGALTMGGPANDSLYRMVPSSDGAYFIAGTTASYGAGGDDVWVIKLDEHGDLIWQKAYGRAGNEELRALVATPDGGAVLAADVTLPGHGYDAWVFRMDASGNLLWSKTLGGTGNDFPRALLPAPDGIFAMVGSTYSAGPVATGWLVGFNSDGTIESQDAFGPPGTELFGEDLAASSDGNYFILGEGYDPPGNAAQAFVLKMDNQGTISWQESIGGTNNDKPYRVVADDAGGCYIVGRTGSFPGGGSTTDGWAAHLSASGQVLWQNRYGEADMDVFEEAVPMPDGGLLIAGTKAYEGLDQGDGWLLKVRASDGAMDSSCNFANSTSFAVTSTSAVPTALNMSPANYTAQTTVTTAVASEVSLTPTTLCSAHLYCTLDGSANAPSKASTGASTLFTATALAPDCPNLPTYAWSFGDGGTSTRQNPSHTYAAAGTFNWSVVMSTGGQSVTRTGSITVVNPPVVSSLKKVSPPFSIVVSGSNLQSGIKVYINGQLWSGVLYKGATKLKLTGSTLKTAVPKGVARTFRFVNPDGGSSVQTWHW